MRTPLMVLFHLLAGLMLAGCCSSPWNKFPMPVAPDRSCRTANVAGYDVYIWNCYEQQRVVIYKYSAEMSCEEPKKETTPCGGQAPIESKLGASIQEGCKSVPVSLRWP